MVVGPAVLGSINSRKLFCRVLLLEAMEQAGKVKSASLADLIRALHQIFENDKIDVDEVRDMLESYKSDPSEWLKYAKFDKYRYTRNLVDEGNGKFNLMILCWGEGHGSSIHDHADSHCFLKLLQGQLKETLFHWPDGKGKELNKKFETILQENQCTYINDSLGVHRVENLSHTEVAVSLHLYSPPFDSCNCFDERTGHKKKVGVTFTSKYGEIIPPTKTVTQENN
ncbi:cysteine dioxygenase type 1-like [Hemiscyllium ocellatum]|uniref:cysteine dioxygenase type 1-like n=1 Tax=Hemiscyllium ocellatum TaxID=170820 RepID=UPI002966F95B|nr:cysteine dioxygenase type 1-like [Hemiscyllium ocellatum]